MVSIILYMIEILDTILAEDLSVAYYHRYRYRYGFGSGGCGGSRNIIDGIFMVGIVDRRRVSITD